MRSSSCGRRLCLLVLAVLGSVACGPPTTAQPRQRPLAALVLDQNFADPDVLAVQGTYYAYATQPSDGSANVSLATSTNLRTWLPAQHDPLPKLPSWAASGRTWAPDVSPAAGGFVMYFTAHSITPDVQCIGVARSRTPEGPFVAVGVKPLICPAAEGGAIDPASFVDTGGRRYLLWKNDGNCCGKDTWLHLQPMAPDGLTVAGPARRLVRQDQAWEGHLVEAPTLIRHGATYVLFYSANDYSGGRYATGYATSPRIDGPYRKAAGPLLTSKNTGVIGPGGQDVVVDGRGHATIVFHGWDPSVVYRRLYTARLQWHGDVPVVSAP